MAKSHLRTLMFLKAQNALHTFIEREGTRDGFAGKVTNFKINPREGLSGWALGCGLVISPCI